MAAEVNYKIMSESEAIEAFQKLSDDEKIKFFNMCGRYRKIFYEYATELVCYQTDMPQFDFLKFKNLKNIKIIRPYSEMTDDELLETFNQLSPTMKESFKECGIRCASIYYECLPEKELIEQYELIHNKNDRNKYTYSLKGQYFAMYGPKAQKVFYDNTTVLFCFAHNLNKIDFKRFKKLEEFKFRCYIKNFESAMTGKKIKIDKYDFKDLNIEYMKLRYLEISLTKCGKIQNLERFSNLEELYLKNNEITKIENLNFPKLKVLDLSHNMITKLENLDKLPNLESFSAHNNHIYKIQNLENLPKLKELILSENRIEKVENFYHLKNLEILELDLNKIVDDENFTEENLLKNFPKLTKKFLRIGDQQEEDYIEDEETESESM